MMSNPSDPAFWDHEWAGDQGWDLGATPPPLLRTLAALPAGRAAVVLGCGRGHEARSLARLGWPRVVGVDFSAAALREAREAEALDAPWEVRPRVEWRQQDVFTLPGTDPGAFDLAVEHACCIAIDPARRPEWARTVAGVLRPGGRLVALLSLKPRAGGPPFALRREELLALLAGAGLAIERSDIPEDSVPSRRGQEILVVAERAVTRAP
jgi:SAM-dependent methyltransferase